MSAGLINSTIETFRIRYHGNGYLNLLRLNPDGNTLSLIRAVTKGFFIGKNSDTNEGAPSHLLTIDLPYTTGLTEDEILAVYMVDEVNPATGKTRRYRTNTETVPQSDDWRYVIELHAAFNDKKAIV